MSHRFEIHSKTKMLLQMSPSINLSRTMIRCLNAGWIIYVFKKFIPHEITYFCSKQWVVLYALDLPSLIYKVFELFSLIHLTQQQQLVHISLLL